MPEIGHKAVNTVIRHTDNAQSIDNVLSTTMSSESFVTARFYHGFSRFSRNRSY